ncbi:MAG: response regulator [Halanaeroarchaeum sp.]
MAVEIRVLHVDDDPEFARLTETFLGREYGGFVVETARNATDGMAAIERFDPDCVVSDYEMPGSDGIEFLESVREEYPDLPFILFTGNGSEEVASEAISADVTDYLQKEVGTGQFTVLANRIRNAVEQYRTEAALAEQRHRYNALFENLGVPVVYFEDEDDRPVVERVNPAFEETFGFDQEAARGKNLDDVVLPDREEDLGRRISERTRAGEMVATDAVRRTTSGERTFHVLSVPLTPGERTTGGFALYTDVTERAERERILKTLHTRTESLFRADTRQEIATLTAATAEETMGYPFTVVRLLTDDGTRLEPVAITEGAKSLLGSRPTYETGEGTAGQAFATGETLVVDDLSEFDDGYDRGAATSGVFVPIDGHGTLSIGEDERGAFDDGDVYMARILAANAAIALDRLERERELERQNDRLDRFASVVSHDLKGPISVARGRLEMVEDGPERVEPVRDALDRMEEMIDDVLALARKGETVDETTDVRLGEIADRCWESVDTEAATLAVETEDAVVADPGRIREIFENLFRNAVEHGGPDVTVRVGSLPTGFYVEDDGDGIDPERRDHVFDYGYTTSADGTGFGLSIVEEIAAAHGWSVTATAGSEGGARFEFRGVGRS